MPPLEKAYRYQKKAAKVGFDWEQLSQVSDKVREELREIEEINPNEGNHAAIEGELGDLLFAVVNLCRHHKVDPALALHGANRKFAGRFAYIEDHMKRKGKSVSAEEFALMDALWNQAKSLEEG
jgi:tetrapyrrole methylase family protein/MazG family protein